MPGAIAKNAQEGTRSEYLAQYALSSFGTSIPVPHPEDSGIDLYCTLGRRIGRRFLVENTYLVQVKSNSNPITYEGVDEVKWLLSHNYPLIICIVNKKKAKIELFQILAISTLIAKNNIDKITLYPSSKQGVEYFPQQIDGNSVDIYLGKPIARFSVTNLGDNDFKNQLCESIKSWVQLDQENINLKETGYTLYRTPKSWKTNEEVEAFSFNGNFRDSIESNKVKQKFDDLFLKMLSQLVNQVAADKDLKKYEELINFIQSYTTSYPHKNSIGMMILQFCVNEGNERLGIQERLNMHTQKLKTPY